MEKDMLFTDYYCEWIELYKKDAVRNVTYKKYLSALEHLRDICPNLRLNKFAKTDYQKILNKYAETHEKQTVQDFHHLIKASVLDAVDEGYIKNDVTRRAVIKGKAPSQKKIKYLNQYELHSLLQDLDLSGDVSWDWLIELVAKTGIRFSEALGLTKEDFDFEHHLLSINKTYDYKNKTGFVPTKNASSVRKISLDWQTSIKFMSLLKNYDNKQLVFVKDNDVYNSTVNSCLERHCKNVNIPIITIHGLRHTHASILLYNGVSVPSVSRRLGHANITTTQKTYLHIIQELENRDNDTIMRAISSL